MEQVGPIHFANNIAIPEGAQPGRYTITLTIRDKVSRQELKEQRFFYVTPAEFKDNHQHHLQKAVVRRLLSCLPAGEISLIH